MNSIYEQITNTIINQLEQGVVPWCKPWVCNGQILSYATGRQYSLLNRMLLAEPGEYASFLEVQKAGGRIRKGAKASRIYFCKPLVKEFEVEKDGVITKETKINFIFKAYCVFHISSCTDLKPRWQREPKKESENKIDENAERIVQNYIGRENINLTHKVEDIAFFSPSRNMVQLPPINMFKSSNSYYETLFHELGHSTGTPNRLNRFTDAPEPFGSASYSKEELVAEMVASFALAQLGLDTKTTHNSNAAYIKNWLDHIRGNVQLIVSAAAKAEKAINYIWGGASEQNQREA